MSKNLIIFYGRTGSTLVQNYVSKYKCSPEFNFTANGFTSSEVHADEHLMYYHNLSEVLPKLGVTDWCMKYHVLSGITTFGTDPMPNGDYNITLTGSDIFFKGTGVTDLHFSFRIDIMDTILSYMIADKSNTFVMTGGEIGSHTRRYYYREYVSRIFHQYSKNYQVYNAYVKKYTNEDQINAMGYCLGGTLLSCGLSILSKKKDTSIKSATFLTTLIDFSDAGDMLVFIDEDQLATTEDLMKTKGFLVLIFTSFL